MVLTLPPLSSRFTALLFGNLCNEMKEDGA